MNAKKILRKRYVKAMKYAIVLVLFAVWIGFLDQHNFSEQVKNRIKIGDLREQKAYYQEKIKEDSLRIHELSTNDENLEKYAREKYNMKKEGEEIFLVAKQENK